MFYSINSNKSKQVLAAYYIQTKTAYTIIRQLEEKCKDCNFSSMEIYTLKKSTPGSAGPFCHLTAQMLISFFS